MIWYVIQGFMGWGFFELSGLDTNLGIILEFFIGIITIGHHTKSFILE